MNEYEDKLGEVAYDAYYLERLCIKINSKVLPARYTVKQIT